MPATRRQQIITMLRASAWTVRGLAEQLEVEPKTILDDLEHVGRSIKPERLRIEPPRCEKCGFVCRPRFTAPSRCPKCRHERFDEPLLTIE